MTADGFFAHIRGSGSQMPGSTSLSATTGSGTMLSYLQWPVCAENIEQLLILSPAAVDMRMGPLIKNEWKRHV